jgi:hypothetical protein
MAARVVHAAMRHWPAPFAPAVGHGRCRLLPHSTKWYLDGSTRAPLERPAALAVAAEGAGRIAGEPARALRRQHRSAVGQTEVHRCSLCKEPCHGGVTFTRRCAQTRGVPACTRVRENVMSSLGFMQCPATPVPRLRLPIRASELTASPASATTKRNQKVLGELAKHLALLDGPQVGTQQLRRDLDPDSVSYRHRAFRKISGWQRPHGLTAYRTRTQSFSASVELAV